MCFKAIRENKILAKTSNIQYGKVWRESIFKSEEVCEMVATEQQIMLTLIRQLLAEISGLGLDYFL